MSRVRWADSASVQVLLYQCRPRLLVFARGTVRAGLDRFERVFELNPTIDVRGEVIDVGNWFKDVLEFRYHVFPELFQFLHSGKVFDSLTDGGNNVWRPHFFM